MTLKLTLLFMSVSVAIQNLHFLRAPDGDLKPPK